MKLKKIKSLATAFMMAATMLHTSTVSADSKAAAAAMKFDLGANVQSDWTSVSASQIYNKSVGYGFSAGNAVANVSASGQGALNDAVQFTGSTTFDVDLAKGLYRVRVTLGNTSRTSVYMENMLQIVNMTGNNAVDEILIPITDGQLNIRAAEGRSGTAFSISAVEIEKVSDDPTLPPTIWFCGDSTVCNYYPLNTSVQGGWGQMLGHYISQDWNIRNMAASGQYAQGFVDAGQFTPIETYGKKGDVYIISIGINDTKYYKGDEYQKIITDMVQRAKKKGMEVILVKQQGRNGDAQRNPLLEGRWYGWELEQIGKAENCQVVDLFKLWQDYCISIGAEKTTALYMDGDSLHPNRSGAEKLAELFSIQFKKNHVGTNRVEDNNDIEDGAIYTFKNVNSGMYLSVENGTASNSSNIAQQKSEGNAICFKAVSAGGGYFNLISQLGDGKSYALDVHARKANNGTNIELYSYNNGINQQFRIVKDSSGNYLILTKVSNESSCVEVRNAGTAEGENIQQWELNGNNCQKWIVEKVSPYTEPTNPIDSNFIYGDLNDDGYVDVVDMVLMRQELVNNKLDRNAKRRADVDADGKVSTADAIQLQQLLLTGKNFSAVNEKKMFVYAVDQKYSEGIEENLNAGFRDKAYINLDNKIGSNIEWNINAPVDGNYLCTFGISNGSTENRKMKIEVNGQSDYWMQDFLSTGSWTAWQERGIVLPLKKGDNSIKTTSTVETGAPNFDYLYIEWTDEPIAEIYTEPQKPSEPQDTGRTVFIAGDSTVQTYRASYAPQQGWGAYLGEYLPQGFNVANHAIAGRSSKSFYDNGRLDTILNSITKDDYLLVQFGINDSASSIPERYAPTCGTVPGKDGSFEFYIAKYIEGAKAKGAAPILVTTTLGLKAYNNSTKKFDGSYQNYCESMKKLASYYKIPCVDLNSLMVNHYNAIGYDAAYKYHMCSTGSSDMTHFTETGAKAVAKLIADEMKKQGIF